MSMSETIISFETAKLAKEKGFDWEVRSSFYKMTFEDTWRNNTDENSKLKNWNIGEYISRPTQSLLAKWLREVHNIDVSAMSVGNINMEKGYLASYHFFKELSPEASLVIHDFLKETYEEALESDLLYYLSKI